jgi:propionyl-CoA carboxylase alpha chain
MFKKILVANRGEIALRIIRTCRKMGIKTVAVYSEADARSVHVREADEAVLLGPGPSQASYLVKEKIVDAALERRCEAIHPGYGFLSENPGLAELAGRSGLSFVGPEPSSIAAMGDKIRAKRLACDIGVPVLPGPSDPVNSADEASCVAEEIGFPVLLKPAAGGGGKGMRIVFEKSELAPAMAACQDEARKAFGDDRVFVERYFPNARHVEIQIMADRFGHVVYLGERECSIQRRYQKIIEESPSPAFEETTRRSLGETACKLARRIGYVNAGTVEFLLDSEGGLHFLEMNTRLQVEHPVTEMVFSVDLVELQLLVAAGKALPFSQDDLAMKGWAIEARVCAEDPSRGFLPSTGMITRYAEPRGRNVRVDSGIAAGSLVTVHYDSLLAKVVTWGATREEARECLVQALNRYDIEGVTTNLDFVNAVLNHPSFVEGRLSTDFIAEHLDHGAAKTAPAVERLHYMAIAAVLVYHNRNHLVRQSLEPMVPKVGPVQPKRKVRRYVIKDGKTSFQIRLLRESRPNAWTIGIDNHEYKVVTPEFEFYRRRLLLKIEGERQYFRLSYQDNLFWIAYCGIRRTLEVYTPKEWNLIRYMPEPKEAVGQDALEAPMPGLVVKINVREGDRVYKGQDLVIIECMKMQTGASSPCNGLVASIGVQEGQAVEAGDVLVTFERK